MYTEVEILNTHRAGKMTCKEIRDHLVASGREITEQAVEHWLSGRRRINLYWFGHVAALLDVPPEEVERGRAAISAAIIARAEAPRKRTGEAADEGQGEADGAEAVS